MMATWRAFGVASDIEPTARVELVEVRARNSQFARRQAQDERTLAQSLRQDLLLLFRSGFICLGDMGIC